MTRERAKELLPAIQAWAKGKPIQVLIEGKWCDAMDANFEDGRDYRVKIEPRRCWMVIKSTGVTVTWTDKEKAIEFANDYPGSELVEMAEVLP